MCVLLFVHVLRKRSRFGGFPCLIVRRKLTPGDACIAELQTRAAKQNKTKTFKKFSRQYFFMHVFGNVLV